MKNRKRMDWPKHGAVFAITILIFSIGILIGSQINQTKMSSIAELSEELRVITMSSELEFAILTENPCEVTDLSFLTEELDELSKKVEFMENQLGRGNPEVLKLKNFYSIVQLRHYLLMTKLVDECEFNLTNIVYFYSNEGDCPECNQQGFILSYLRNIHPINVYSIDINSENSAIRALKTIHKVETAPSLIIDGEVFEGFKTRNELLELI